MGLFVLFFEVKSSTQMLLIILAMLCRELLADIFDRKKLPVIFPFITRTNGDRPDFCALVVTVFMSFVPSLIYRQTLTGKVGQDLRDRIVKALSGTILPI